MFRKATIVITAILMVSLLYARPHYKDGIYTGVSRSCYTQEPYYGITKITVERGLIVSISFIVRDSLKHEDFSETYEKYFAGNPEYIKQCRNDWQGICSYPKSLLQHQNISKVDATSGATWSYNLFKDSFNQAVGKMKHQPR
ncbi:MAG: FMN-binding protein [Bacteroidales bacterium]|nr:FMN-binding protein [Bacteroidales bacterium]